MRSKKCTMHTSKDYLHIFLDMGDALLNSGAETLVWRIH